MSQTLKVMLVGDHEIDRQGLRTMLEAEDDIEVTAEADSGASAVSLASVHKPDVVVMDMRMPGGSGVEACRAIRDERPDAQVIMLTSFSGDEALFNSIMAGAAGFVLKQIRGRDLVDAIRTVGAGKSLLDPDVTQRVLERLRKAKFDERRQAGATVAPRGTDLGHDRRRVNESGDCCAHPPLGQDREELCVQHLAKARSRAKSRSSLIRSSRQS